MRPLTENMKKFHISGTAEMSWLVSLDAETEGEARAKAEELVQSGQTGDERISFIQIQSCDEEDGFYGETEEE